MLKTLTAPIGGLSKQQKEMAVKMFGLSTSVHIWTLSASYQLREISSFKSKNFVVMQKEALTYSTHRYVHRPMLYSGKKFHLRCYGIILANLTPILYEKCYVLTAGRDFQTETTEMSCHITNLSVNKRFPGHPGQIPCDLPVEYPDVRSVFILHFLL